MSGTRGPVKSRSGRGANTLSSEAGRRQSGEQHAAHSGRLATKLLMPLSYLALVAQEFPDHESLIAGTDVTTEQLEAGQSVVPVEDFLRIWSNVLDAANDPVWHFRYGSRLSEDFHGPMTFAVLSAPTLGEGLDAFARYSHSRIPYFRFETVLRKGSYRLELFELVDLMRNRTTLVDVPLQTYHGYVRRLAPQAIPEMAIEFAFDEPSYHREYASWFRCPVRFGARCHALVLPQKWRAIRNPMHDEGIWQSSLRKCDHVLANPPQVDTVSQLRRVLFDILEAPGLHGTRPSLQRVAGELNLTPRTLIRRLKLAGGSYQMLLDEVQKHRASELLGVPGLHIYEVAEQLGYPEPANFGRTFHRWFGMSPGAYRRRIANR